MLACSFRIRLFGNLSFEYELSHVFVLKNRIDRKKIGQEMKKHIFVYERGDFLYEFFDFQ